MPIVKKEKKVQFLTATGPSGIITKFKISAEAGRTKKLKKTGEDGDRVKDLILVHDAFKNLIKTQGLIHRLSLNKKHLSLIIKQIKIAVIQQGYISKSTLARFRFNPSYLAEKITYRKLIEGFLIENIVEIQNNYIRTKIFEEAKKGGLVDTFNMSNEFSELMNNLKLQTSSGKLTQVEIDAGWLKLGEVGNKDKSLIYKKQAKIENLCYYISFNPSNPSLSIIDSKKLLSLSTSNIERIIRFYCRIMNIYNKNEIDSKRKSDKRLRANKNYKPKKHTSADQKKKLVQKYKAMGLNQKEVAKKIGCSERLVRTYWK